LGDDASEEAVGALPADVTCRLARMKGTEPMLSGGGSGETVVAGWLAASSRGSCDAHQSNPFISKLHLLLRAHSIKVWTDVAVACGPASLGRYVAMPSQSPAERTTGNARASRASCQAFFRL
jgi:hypothetical protein